MYKIPVFRPFPADPPLARLDSADMRHIGHCALSSGDRRMMHPNNRMNESRILCDLFTCSMVSVLGNR